MDGWIKCSYRMPNNYTPVRIKTLCGRTGVMYWSCFKWVKAPDFGCFKISDVPGDAVTHWQPLPLAPEE